jgi:hypothetical protein
MSSAIEVRPAPKALFWTGWILSVLPALMLVFSGVMMVVKPPFIMEGLAKHGYPEGITLGLGIVLLVSTALYLIPRTSTLGAILLTGYLGGATATHVRVGEPFYFPVIFGAVIWLGLLLREPRLRLLLPLRS